MYIREVKNRSGTVSIQKISKHKGKYKVVKSIGYGHSRQEIDVLHEKAHLEISNIDMTTLHLEASYDDDLRETGFSKVGRHQDPQILIVK